MKPNPLPFLFEKWAGVPEPTATFTGQTVVVTGANSGLGLETAVKFAALGASKVVLAVRNISKGQAAQRQIEERVHRKGVVEVWDLDMDNFAHIRAFATKARRELERLDVVVLNAGVSPTQYKVSSDGWESVLQVNVLGTALLGLLLLPKLEESERITRTPSRMVIVTSEAHRWIEASDIPDTSKYEGNILQACNAKPANDKYDGLVGNARSKLFAQYVSNSLAELASRRSGNGKTIVTSVCPGACKSDLMRDVKADGGSGAIAIRVFDLLFNKPSEQGARSYVAATSLGPESHGKWFKTTKLTPQGDLVTSPQGQKVQQQVWSEIVSALQDKVPAVRDIVSAK